MALFNLEDALTPGGDKDPGSLGKLEPPTQAALPVQGDVPPAMSAEGAQQEAAGFQRRKQAFDESKIQEELKAAGLRWNPALGLVVHNSQGMLNSVIADENGSSYFWRDSSVSGKIDPFIAPGPDGIKDGWYTESPDGKFRLAKSDNPLAGYEAKLVRDPATGKPTMEIAGIGIWRSPRVTGQKDVKPGFYGKDGRLVHDDKLPTKGRTVRALKKAGKVVHDWASGAGKLASNGYIGSGTSDNNVYANASLSVVNTAANNMFSRNITTFIRHSKAEALDKVTNGLIDPKIGGIRVADVKKRLDELFYSQAEHGTEFARPYVDTDETYALSALLDTANGKDVIPVRDIKRLTEAHHNYTRYRMENRNALTERNALAEANFTISLGELSDLQFELNSLRKEFPASELQQRVPPEMRDSYLSAVERFKAVQQKLAQAKELTPELESEFNAARNAYSSEALKIQRFRTKDKARFDQILAEARSIRRGLRDDLEFLPENDKGQQRLIDAIESSEGKFGALAYDTALMLVGAGQAGRINVPSLFTRSTAKNVLRRVGTNVTKGAVRVGSQSITFKAGSGGLDVTAGAAMNAANPEADQGIAKQIAHDLGYEAAMLPFDMVLFSQWGHRISHRFSKTVPQILATQTIRAGALTTLSLGLSAAYTGIPLTPEQFGETALHFGAYELIAARRPVKEIGRWRDVLSKKHGAWMESFPSAEYARIPLMEAQEQLGSRLKALDAEAKKNPNDEAVRNDLKETRDKVLELSERWAAVEAAEKFGFAPWSKKQEAAKVEPGKPADKEPAANAEPIPAKPTDRSGYDTALAPGLKTVHESAPSLASLAHKAAPAPKREAPVDSDVYLETFKNGVRIYRDGADSFGVDMAESAKLIAEASKLFTSGSETGRADAIRMLNEATMKLASEHAERLKVEPKEEPAAAPRAEEAKPKGEPAAEPKAEEAMPKEDPAEPKAEEAKPKEEDTDFDIDLSALDSYDVPSRALESMGEGTVDMSLKSKVEAIAEKDPNVKLALDTRNTIRETIENLKKAGIDEKQLAPYYSVHRNASQTLKDALVPHGITFEKKAAAPAPPKPEPVQSPSKKSFTQRIMDAGKRVVGKKPAAEPTKGSIATQRRSIREKASLLMADIRDQVQVFGDTWKDDTVNNRVKAIRREATAEMERALEDFMADASVTPEQRRAFEGRRKIDYDAESGKKTVTGGKVDPNALPTLVESPMVRDIAGDSPAFRKMEERVKASARKLAEGYASLAKHHSTSEKHRILSEMVPMLDDLSRRAGQMDPADFDVVQDLIRDANLIAKSVSTGAGIDGPLWQNFYRNALRAGIRMGRHSYRNEASRIWIKKVAGELGHDEAAVSSALDAAEALGIGTDLRKELDRHLRNLAKSKPGAFDRKLMASGAPKGAEAPAAIRMRDRARLAREVDYLLSARHEADRVLESDPKHDTFIEDAPLAAKRFKADYPALRMLGVESLKETAEALKDATANTDKLRLTRIQRILGDGDPDGVMQRLSDDVAKHGPLEVTVRPDATEAESLTFNWMAGSKQRSDGSETSFDVAVPMPNDVRTMDIMKGWVEMPGGAMPTEVTGHFFNEPSWRVQIQQAMTSMLSREGAASYGVKVPAGKPGPYVGWEGKREETRNRITERPDTYGDRMPFITMEAKAEVEKSLVEGAQRLAAHREKVEKEGRITKRPKTRHRLRVPWFDADPNADSILKRMLDAGYVVAPVKRVQRTSLEAAAYVAEVNGAKGAKEMAIRVPKGARVIDVDMLKAILGPQMNDVALNQHFRINDSSANLRRSLEEYLDGSFGAEDGYSSGATDALRAVDAENALLADRRLMDIADKRRSDYMRDRKRFDAERERILNQLHADGILSRSDWMTMVRSVDDVATQIRNTGSRLSITARREFRQAIESELQTGALATVKTRSLRTRTRDAVKAVAGDEAALAFVREFFDPVGENGVDPGLKPSPRVKDARGRDVFSGPSTAQQMKAALKERYGIESIPEDAGWRNVSDVSGGTTAGAEDLKALALQHAALKAARRLTDERYRTSGDAEEVLIEAGQRRADEAAGEANELRASRDGLSPVEKGRLTREAKKVEAAGELERQEALGSAEIMQKAPRKVSDADALILGEFAEGTSFTPQEQRLVDLADSLGRKIGEPIVLPGDRAGTGDTLMPKDQIALVNPSHPEHVRVSRMVDEVFGQQPERNRYTEDAGTEYGDAMRDLLAAAAEERAGGRFSGQIINFSSGSEGLRFTNSRGETKIVNLSQHREWVPEVVDGIHAELEKRGAGMFTSNDLITEVHRRLLPAISGDMNTQGIMRSIVTEAWRRTGQESRIQSYENKLSSIRNTIDKVADWSGHMAQRDTAFAEALHELGDTTKIGERVKKNRDGLRQFMEALDPRIVEGLTVANATGKANANGAAGRYLNDTIELLKPAAVHAKALEMLDRFRPKAGTASRMEQRIDELMKRFRKGDTKWAEKAGGAMVFEPKDWSLVDEADARALATRIAAAEYAGKGRLEVISTAAHEVQHWLETWTDGAVKQRKIALYEEARREFLASPEGVWHREFFEGDDAMFMDIRATVSTKNALKDFADRVAAVEGELKAGGYNVEWNAKVYGVEMPTITTKEGRAVGMVDNNGAYRVSMDRAYYHFRNASEFSAVMGEHALRLASEQAGHGKGNLKSRLEGVNSALDRAAAAAADEAMVLRDTMQAAGISPVLLNHPEMRDLTFNVLADAIGPNRYTGWAKGGSTFEANGIDMREGGDLLVQMQGMSRGKAIEKTGELYRKLFNLPESYDAGSPVTIEHFAKLDKHGNIKWAGGFDGAKAVNDNMGVMLRKGIQSFISADSITNDTRHVAQLLTPQLMRVMALTQSDSVALGGTFASDKGRAQTAGSVGPHLHFQRLALQDHSAPVIARIEAELAKKPNRVVDAQDAREAITVTIDDPQMPNSKMTYWVQTDPKSGKVTNCLSERMFDAWNYLESDGKAETTKLTDGDKFMLDYVRRYLRETNRQHVEAFSQIPGVNREALLELLKETDQIWISRIFTKQASGERSTRIHDQTYEIDNAVEDVMNPLNNNLMRSERGRLEQRRFETIGDAVKSGFLPKFQNPIEAALEGRRQLHNLMLFRTAISHMEDAGLMIRTTPDNVLDKNLYREIPLNMSADVKRALGLDSRGALLTDPELQSLRMGGQPDIRLWYKPEAGPLMNSIFGKGMSSNVWFRRLMDANAALNQIQLVGPFHMTVTAGYLKLGSILAGPISDAAEWLYGQHRARGAAKNDAVRKTLASLRSAGEIGGYLAGGEKLQNLLLDHGMKSYEQIYLDEKLTDFQKIALMAAQHGGVTPMRNTLNENHYASIREGYKANMEKDGTAGAMARNAVRNVGIGARTVQHGLNRLMTIQQGRIVAPAKLAFVLHNIAERVPKIYGEIDAKTVERVMKDLRDPNSEFAKFALQLGDRADDIFGMANLKKLYLDPKARDSVLALKRAFTWHNGKTTLFFKALDETLQLSLGKHVRKGWGAVKTGVFGGEMLPENTPRMASSFIIAHALSTMTIHGVIGMALCHAFTTSDKTDSEDKIYKKAASFLYDLAFPVLSDGKGGKVRDRYGNECRVHVGYMKELEDLARIFKGDPVGFENLVFKGGSPILEMGKAVVKSYADAEATPGMRMGEPLGLPFGGQAIREKLEGIDTSSTAGKLHDRTVRAGVEVAKQIQPMSIGSYRRAMNEKTDQGEDLHWFAKLLLTGGYRYIPMEHPNEKGEFKH